MFPYSLSSLSRELSEIELWRARMDQRRPLTRSWQGRLRRDLEAEAVAASTRMEGVVVTVDDVRQILAGEAPSTVSAVDAALVRGYRDAMTFVLRRADDPNFAWNRELIVGVHDRVLAGRYEDGAGRLRTAPSHVIDRLSHEVVFEPPPYPLVPELVDRLCSEIDRAVDPPAVQAAWFHVAFAAIHPFADGNGRTARVLASLLMYRGGFRTRTFTSLEEWWGRPPADYYESFRCLGSRFSAEADVTPFLRAHISAQLSQIRALDLRERTTRGLWITFENVLTDRRLPGRLANALWDAFFGHTVTSRTYRDFVDVSPATATSDLRAATAAGLLGARGERRGRRYVPGGNLFAVVAEELSVQDLPATPEESRAVIVAELARRLAGSDDGVPAQQLVLALPEIAPNPSG